MKINANTIMYAVYSSPAAKKPMALFTSRWKAQSAMRALWNCRKAYIKRVMVEQTGATYYEILSHEVKRITNG